MKEKMLVLKIGNKVLHPIRSDIYRSHLPLMAKLKVRFNNPNYANIIAKDITKIKVKLHGVIVKMFWDNISIGASGIIIEGRFLDDKN